MKKKCGWLVVMPLIAAAAVAVCVGIIALIRRASADADAEE